MRTSKALWRTIGLTATAATLVLLFGFSYALNDLLNPKKAVTIDGGNSDGDIQASFQSIEEYRITAVGDSLTKGAGDETGEGYVKQVVSKLKEKTGKPVTLVNNLAINGLRADQLAEKLANDEGYRRSLREANLILLSIGGNDLFQFAQTGAEGAGPGGIDPDRAEVFMGKGLSRLSAVIQELTEINPNARLVYLGLYNPFYDIPELRSGSLQVQEWNAASYKMIHDLPQGVVVPTYDLFEETIAAYLSTDHFHPNHKGYTEIANRIVQILE